jgi:Glycosyltransferase family 25 (LPS biosynthesis protein)
VFDRIVCINLDFRQDRWGAFKAKIDSIPLLQGVCRIRAIHGDTVGVPSFYTQGGGAWGCRQSHLRALEDALMDGIQTLLVFEDDVCFAKDFQYRLTEFMSLIPNDWHGLMLGGQHVGPDSTPRDTYVPSIKRSRNTQRTHAYAVRGKTSMQYLYKLWSRCDTHIDHWLPEWQASNNVYEPDEFFCGQDEGRSDILGREVERRFWMGLRRGASERPFALLKCPRQVAEELVLLGVHFGHSRIESTGFDKGLIALERGGWQQDELLQWVEMIQAEADDADGIPGIWHSVIPPIEDLRSAVSPREVIEIEATTLCEALPHLPSLRPHVRAREILWAWCGPNREILEGLAYHGFHRGYHRDEVTGLDQGVRRCIEMDDYENLPVVMELLRHQASLIRRGKPLVSHPALDMSRLAQVPRSSSFQIVELKGNRIAEILEQFWSIVNA